MKAPEFSLLDQNGETHSLEKYKGKFVLLYFYPKDDTPGCTIEACSFRDNLSELKKLNVVVLGASGDDVDSHGKFVKKFDLNFPLLADTNNEVGKAYSVFGEKTLFGKLIMGYHRQSFLIGPDGEMVKHYDKVKPEEHVAEIIADVKKYA